MTARKIPKTHSANELAAAFPACRAALGETAWERLVSEWEERGRPDFIETLALSAEAREKPYLAELARLEAAMGKASKGAGGIPAEVRDLAVNPTVELFETDFANLAGLIAGDGAVRPEPGQELVLVWHDPRRNRSRAVKASDDMLLALKLAAEGRDPVASARAAGQDPAKAIRAVDRASGMGLVLRPPSKIRREPDFCAAPLPELGEHLACEVFTIQWHITQACDLKCKHCYDRSERRQTTLAQGLGVLDKFADFCAETRVEGQVSFTGGNPLLHPDFIELYRQAARRGFRVALLANPTTRERLTEMIAVKRPEFYQISLEGLEDHNDYIRGKGHFRRTLEFLALLKELGIYSMVMLTLTRANQDQVLPLAEVLRQKADLFTFNRLSAVGEGANLLMAGTEGYREFLSGYLDAAANNPCMGLKDNLLNVLIRERNMPAFGGCAGFGCGAAFNFLAVLPDGEVHACRKFPSRIGDIFEQSLTDIYDSEQARRYRLGSAACAACGLKPVCGGCLAVISSSGLDPFRDIDPYCFARPRAD